jgi:NADH-quinone oxidoreductase subunit D
MAQVQDIEIPDSATRAAQVVDDLKDIEGDRMVLNMGPSHPATHGVLRIVLELDGEEITKADPDVGYLHRGDEKIAENMTYTQFIPYTDRLDYLAPLANNVAYALAVEKALGIHDKLPPRCQYIRVMCCELARISSHLLGLGAFAMDVGAVTVFLLVFTEREKIYNLAEAASGARFTTSYTRIGGLSRDIPPAWCDQVRQFIKECSKAIAEVEVLLTRNRIWVDRLRDLGHISKETAIDYALSGPNLRGSGIDWDLRKNQPYLCYKDLEFDIPVGSTGDCYDRYLVRMEEMRQSLRILEQCVNKIPGGAENKTKEPVNIADGKVVLPPKDKVLSSMEELIHQFMLVTEGVNVPPGDTYFGHENPKGELGFYIHSKGGGVPHRMKIRSPSFINLSILSELMPGHMISDVPVILGSLDFVMGESDR